MYVISKSGREVWESQDASVPEQYRLLLWLVDVQGEKRALRTLLAQHPERLVRDWLAELRELGFLESRPDSRDDTTIPLSLNAPKLAAGAQAATSLQRYGAYLALEPSRGNRPRGRTAETTVLIAEDDPDQLALADLRLSMAGYRVRTAASVSDLLRALFTGARPDLLLLDAVLPDGDGFEVLSKIRRHPAYAELPIVMLTAKADPADVGKGLAWGADGYVTKPYSKNVLAQVIARVLE